MKVSIFGLGYVGAVSAGCLATDGHSVVGVEPVDAKLDLINAGRSPIVEKGLNELIAAAVKKGALRATKDSREAILATDMTLICVGTPSKRNGDIDLSHVSAVSAEIGQVLKEKPNHTVVFRSTMLPGSMRGVVIPALVSASGKQPGKDFGVGNNPEFLREGSAIDDFYNPSKTVIGTDHPQTGKKIAALYEGIKAPLIVTSIEAAEMVKYADNAWHALKVSFANEVGAICKAITIDSHQVMDIFCEDKKLNLSASYLKPGFSFGGSCLPKDVRALTYKGRMLGLDLPLLNSVLPSNEKQTARGLEMIMAQGKRPVTFLGLSFKAGTDDVRESPMVELIERLLGKGYDIRIYDQYVNLAKLVGANREYLLKTIPHVSGLLVNSLEEALKHGKTIVVGNRDPEFSNIASRVGADQFVIDLVRIKDIETLAGRYDGVNW